MSWIRRGTLPLGPLAAFLSAVALTPPLGAQTDVGAPATLSATSSSAEATQLFFEGIFEAQNIGTARAIELMDRAIGLDGGFGMALAAKAFLDGGLSASERTSTFSRAIGELGDATPAEIAFATALREWRAGNTTAAKRMLEVASEAAPGDANIAFYHAQLVGNTGTAQEGVVAMRAVTERFPEHAPAFNILAYGLYRGGDTEGALEAVRRYLQLASSHWNAHDSMAEMMAWEGRFDEALTHYGHVNRMAPNLVQGYQGRAEVHTLMGDGAAARAAMSEALGVVTADAATIQLHRGIGHSAALVGDRNGAMRALGTAAQTATERGNANLASLSHQDMALIEALSGNGRNVQGHLDAAAAAGGNEGRQTALTALALALGGELRAATSAAAELTALAQVAESWRVVSHQVDAVLKLRQGDAAGAKTAVGSLDPSDLMTKAILAHVYDAQGQEAAAFALRQDVLNDRTATLLGTPWMIARLYAAQIDS